MNKMPNNIVPDEEVFDLGTRRTLADVLAACEASLTGTALRDTRSAFRFLAKKADVDLAATLARPEELRQLFGGLSYVRIGIGEKRLANICALVTSAVTRFGMRRTRITREIPLNEAWRALLARVPDPQHRWGLSRLGCYCTLKGIAPHDVTSETLLGLHAALEAESVSKDPRNLIKRTIALWNICCRRVPDWPGAPLSSPFKTEPYMLPLEAFPAGFQEAVAAFEARMRKPDPSIRKRPAAPSGRIRSRAIATLSAGRPRRWCGAASSRSRRSPASASCSRATTSGRRCGLSSRRRRTRTAATRTRWRPS